MKSKDILNLFYLKFKSKSKFKFSNIASKYLFMNHFNIIFMKYIKNCKKISFLLIIFLKIFIKSIWYVKLIYCDHPNRNVEHSDLRIIKIWFQQK